MIIPKNHRLGAVHRPAFTLIELLAVIFVLGLLIALLIPAVQSARAASRRAQCLSNLHQIGLGVHNYLSACGVFPSANNGLNYSPLVQILPFIEQANYYNSINYNIRMDDFSRMNLTILNSRVALYLCPSDPVANSAGPYASYAGCEGNGLSGSLVVSNGLFSSALYPLYCYYFSPAAVTDGLSHTAAFSEWLVHGGPREPPVTLRLVFGLGFSGYTQEIPEGEFIDICRNPSGLAVMAHPKGLGWYTPGSGTSTYNHTLLPNDPSCFGPLESTYRAMSASSLHGGGVNVLLCDGSARFVRDTIALAAWRATATRAGGEIEK